MITIDRVNQELIAMRSQTLHLLGMLLVLPPLSIGCTTPRQHLSNQNINPPSTQTGDSVDASSSLAPRQNPPVRAVAYQSESVVNSTDEPSDQAVQPAVPVELESVTAYVEPGGMTLEAIEQLAMANNPAIQQASAAAAQASGIRTQVGLKPNPTIGYNGTQLGDVGTDQHTAFISQTFVRGDKLAWNQQVIGHDVNAMNWQIETQRQRIRTDIRLAFYDALAAQRRLQLAQDFRGVAMEGVSVSMRRVEAKVGTRPDVLQSEIQLSEVNLSVQQAEFELAAALNELAALAGVTEFGATTLIGDLDAIAEARNLESEFAQIVAASPQLAAAHAAVDRAKANLQRQRIQAIPNVTAQLGVGADNGTNSAFANAQLSMPLPIYNKNQGNVRAAYAEYCAATQNVQRIRQSIRSDLARVMREFNIADATVRQYRESILPKADETLKLIREAQNAGEFDFLRVLTARRAYFDANLRYVTALGKLAQANAKIDGLLLSGGLSNVVAYENGDDLRGQALSGE